jgi:hypothetical protein
MSTRAGRAHPRTRIFRHASRRLRLLAAPSHVRSSVENDPERPAAPARAATAGNAFQLDRIMVIPRQFFPGADLAPAVQIQAAAHSPRHHIGCARMIHEFGAAATPPAVHARSGSKPCDVNVFGRPHLDRLHEGQAFTGIFDHAPTRGNVLEREHLVAV